MDFDVVLGLATDGVPLSRMQVCHKVLVTVPSTHGWHSLAIECVGASLEHSLMNPLDLHSCSGVTCFGTPANVRVDLRKQRLLSRERPTWVAWRRAKVHAKRLEERRSPLSWHWRYGHQRLDADTNAVTQRRSRHRRPERQETASPIHMRDVACRLRDFRDEYHEVWVCRDDRCRENRLRVR